MSGAEQLTVGQILRDAREALGMNVEAAAARLRLMRRQVEAIEADDFEGLGRPVFARGFVRNYAKLLGIEPDALLERMEGPTTVPMMSMRRPEPPLPRSWLSSPWLLVALLAGLAVVAVPVGLYWWLNQGEEELLHKLPQAVRVEPVELGMPAPDEAPAPSPETVAPAVEPSAGTAPPSTPAADEAPALPPEPAAAGVLQFDFADDSWVEVRDAGGRAILRQLNPAGGSIEVRGRPPFRLLVGNAAQVRMTYNGRLIDLKPFIDVTVARFTLEE